MAEEAGSNLVLLDTQSDFDRKLLEQKERGRSDNSAQFCNFLPMASARAETEDDYSYSEGFLSWDRGS